MSGRPTATTPSVSRAAARTRRSTPSRQTRAHRELLACVAAANGVAIGIEGAAGVEELRALPAGRALVVMDCEGCEATLLDPDVPSCAPPRSSPSLHDFAVSGDTVVARFASTHDITVIPTRAPPPEHSTALALGLSEYRPGPMRWAVMFPR